MVFQKDFYFFRVGFSSIFFMLVVLFYAPLFAQRILSHDELLLVQEAFCSEINDLFLVSQPVIKAADLLPDDYVFWGFPENGAMKISKMAKYRGDGICVLRSFVGNTLVVDLVDRAQLNLEKACGRAFSSLMHSQFCPTDGTFVFFGRMRTSSCVDEESNALRVCDATPSVITHNAYDAIRDNARSAMHEAHDCDAQAMRDEVRAPEGSGAYKAENGNFACEQKLVNIADINPAIRVDLLYAKENNFVGEIMYDAQVCYLRKGVADKLDRVQKALEKEGLGLLVTDAYRPWSVQKILWARCPVEGLVAPPAKISKHNRGAAVDVTLVRLSDGKELDMGCPVDEMSERASRSWVPPSIQAYRNRKKLEDAMVKEGFLPLPSEWWHFDDGEWEKFSACDELLSELLKRDKIQT